VTFTTRLGTSGAGSPALLVLVPSF
jgi:hypothetical protein